MRKETYTTRAGVKQYRPVLSARAYSAANNENAGFCLACGSEAYGVEPDARKYTCEGCQQPKVYGLEELLMMGLVKLTGNKAEAF